MTDYKAIVSKSNAKRYAWPAGWDRREKVAQHLECSPSRVSELLDFAIKDGVLESKIFEVWDEDLQRKLRVVGYRKRKEHAEPATAVPEPARATVVELDAKSAIIRAASRHGNNPKAIQKNLAKKYRGVITVDMIRRVLG